MEKNVLRNEKDLFDSSGLWSYIVEEAKPLYFREDVLFYSAEIDREYRIEELFSCYSACLNGNIGIIKTPSDIQNHLESSAEKHSGYFTPGSSEGIWRLHLPSVIYDARRRIDVLENLLQDVTTYIEQEEVFNLEKFISNCKESRRDIYCQEMILVSQELFQMSLRNPVHLSFISNGSERLVGLDQFHLDNYLRKFYKLISKSDKLSTSFCLDMLKDASSLSKNKRQKLEINRYDATDHFTLTLDSMECKNPEDAISYKEYDKIIRIGMHIVDITHKVLPNNYLDRKTQERVEDQFKEKHEFMLPFGFKRKMCLVQEKKRTVISLFFDFDKDTKCIKNYFLTQSEITVDERHTLQTKRKQSNKKQPEEIQTILEYLQKMEEFYSFLKLNINEGPYQNEINRGGLVPYLAYIFNSTCRRILTDQNIPFLKNITFKRSQRNSGKGHFTGQYRKYEALFNIRQLTSYLFNTIPEYDPTCKSIEDLMKKIEKQLLEDNEKT